MHLIYGRNDLCGVARELHPICDPQAGHLDPLIGIDISPEVIAKVLWCILSQYECK